MPTRSLIWRSLAYGFRRVEDGLLDGGIRKNYCFEGDRGENLLETIETTARANRVANGVIISAIGTLENCRIHRVTSQKLPPEEEYVDIDGPLK